MKIKQVVSRN